MSNKIKLTLLSLLITRILFSQLYLKPDLFSLDKGLLNPTVTSLATDSKGFIWTGTENGLYRYDGYRFKMIGQPSSKTGLIGLKRIIKIQVDNKNDNLWLLTSNGVELYNRKTGVITVYSSQLIQSGNKPVKSFVDLYTAPDQPIWIINESGLFKMIPGSSVKAFGIPEENTILTCMTGDNHGNLWIGTNNGMLVFDMNSEKFTKVFSEKNDNTSLLTAKYITCLYIDGKENLWIGTQHGLNRFNPVDIDFDKIYPLPEQKNHPANEIRCIEEDKDGNLVLITGKGIVIYNPLTYKFNLPKIDLPNQMLNAQLSSMLIDRQGIFWIGTSRGLIKIRKASVTIENIYAGEKSSYFLPENNLTAIWEDPSGKLWLGYRNSGITVSDISGKSIAYYHAGGQGIYTLSGNSIQSFFVGKQTSFYCISATSIDKYNPHQQRFESIFILYPFIDMNLFKDRQLFCMTEDTSGNLLVGTNKGIIQLDILNRRCKSYTVLKQDHDSLTISEVYDLEVDRFNNLWLGTDDGLVLYNFGQNYFNRFTPYEKDLLNTGHKRVYSIVKGENNNYWIGTSEGCYQFDIVKKTFAALSGNLELLTSEVLSIVSDIYNNLWIGTSQGVFYYSPAQQTFRHFDFNDGLDNYGFNLNASSKSASKKVYFGGKYGLTIIHYKSAFTDIISPPTTITGVGLLHKGKIYKEFYEIPDTIKIPYGNYAVKIDFMLPDFSQPEKNQYRYQFSQTQKSVEWNELSTSNSLMLSGFKQGNFQFKIIGSTRNGEWNSPSGELTIIVEVPFWRSRPAYTIYFILLVVLIALTFRYWARQLISANKQYKEKEKIARQIMLQKEELTLKNKSITDSINYARRIQNAMLPPIKLLKSYFPQSFLLYLPKDIVSGDFYWINKLYNKIFIAAVDCTGHGVPGAFMSIIGFELFRKITNIEGLSRPSDILNKLNEDFHEIFRDVENVVLRDGMDVAFCAIDINDMILEFSGAFNPLYLIRDNKITEIKGDRFAIGIDETNFKDQTFKNHMIPLQEGDLIYIFSDGYADQFGGPEGKKFKYRRFRHLLLNIHQIPMEDQQNILETSLREWKGEHEQVDDVMVMGIKVDF
jgi:ligand-binding sensor domain-containing protein/serine phosphatase RsbU (regulator of sigma subunit)